MYPPPLPWTEIERPGGTDIQFAAQGNAHLKYWFGHERPEVLNRLYVFAQTGAEGSMAAFWLDDDDRQCIVHLGSGSGSTLVCVLAQDAVDFLRLLAIGYDEICWPEEFSDPPNLSVEDGGVFVRPNVAYQEWVKRTFGVSIPETALEIVQHPCEMTDPHEEAAPALDPFLRWVEANSA